MGALSSHLLAALVGFLSGFLVSIPVGPINVSIVNEGGRRGFVWGLLIGMGAVVMEVVYCTIGFAGFSGFFTAKLVKATMELISFLLMLFLGLKYLFAHSIEATSRSADKIEERLHPHSAFMTGFVRVLGNPMVLLFWIALSATFISHEWVEPTWSSKGACVAGVGLGAGAWFVLLAYVVARTRDRLSTNILLRMSQFSGASLLVMSMIIGVRIVLLLAHR